jgi:hypothetical protein
MVRQKLPDRIHQSGSIFLRHLGEVLGGASDLGESGLLAGFLLHSPEMDAVALGAAFGPALTLKPSIFLSTNRENGYMGMHGLAACLTGQP